MSEHNMICVGKLFFKLKVSLLYKTSILQIEIVCSNFRRLFSDRYCKKRAEKGTKLVLNIDTVNRVSKTWGEVTNFANSKKKRRKFPTETFGVPDFAPESIVRLTSFIQSLHKFVVVEFPLKFQVPGIDLRWVLIGYLPRRIAYARQSSANSGWFWHTAGMNFGQFSFLD